MMRISEGCRASDHRQAASASRRRRSEGHESSLSVLQHGGQRSRNERRECVERTHGLLPLCNRAPHCYGELTTPLTPCPCPCPCKRLNQASLLVPAPRPKAPRRN